MKKQTKISILGAAGRMGQHLIQATYGHKGAMLSGALVRAGHKNIGQTIHSINTEHAPVLTFSDNTETICSAADVLIDFTNPDASHEFLQLALQYKKPLVIGTTGLSEKHEENIKQAAKNIPIIYSANYSVGVNILLAATEQIARATGALFDIEIFESHHKNKIDAPSGTALALGKAAARGRGVDFDHARVNARQGHTGPRPTGAIGFSVMRGGDVVGDHDVHFLGPAERITLSHHAEDRSLFAKGAVRAALWAAQQKPGLYSMRDVLGV